MENEKFDGMLNLLSYPNLYSYINTKDAYATLLGNMYSDLKEEVRINLSTMNYYPERLIYLNEIYIRTREFNQWFGWSRNRVRQTEEIIKKNMFQIKTNG